MTAPIPVRVVRHACPHCGRTHSRPVRAREHMARCWRNPEARGCKTCTHFQPGIPGEVDTGWPGETESCGVGVSLAGRPKCKTCGGFGDVPGVELGMTECPDCSGDGAEVKPGPIVRCHSWQLRTEEDE